jgi:hypothetical protein
MSTTDETDDTTQDNDIAAPSFIVTLKRTLSLCRSELFLIFLGVITIIGDILSTIGENKVIGRLIDVFTREGMI